VLHPLNHSGDQEGCTRLPDGSVRTPKGFKEAYAAFRAGGWQGLSADPAYGGQGLPYILAVCINEMISSANMAFGMYPGLARGAADAIYAHGTDEQKSAYLPKMISGEWTGTMNLTEPHCGTDLGLLRSKAAPQADGSYKISGQKIFISAGEHDLADNIIHLVLARIEGAPEGVKGISLFIVPKFLLKADGSVGAFGLGDSLDLPLPLSVDMEQAVVAVALAAAAALGMDGWGDGRWARMADALSLPAGEIPTGGNVAPPSPPQVATDTQRPRGWLAPRSGWLR